ncbi:hypothetical protein METP1_02259 [Methanosarcinales archaeon]|nr:hypothetical protein METP1_02259 [Methanosarcinales archaeon]
MQSGVRGLDEITDRGLLKGRPTLVCGSADAQIKVYEEKN